MIIVLLPTLGLDQLLALFAATNGRIVPMAVVTHTMGTLGEPSRVRSVVPPEDAEGFSATVAAVTSAFGDPTRRGIYLYVRENAGATASEVAEFFDIHPNVARHHLDRLVNSGYLEIARDWPLPRGAGRPSKHYRPSAMDATVDFLAGRTELLLALLNQALSMLGPERAEEMAERVGEEYGRALASQIVEDPGKTPRQSAHEAVAALADALTAHGFSARAEKRGESVAVVSESCPFGEAVAQNPVVCAVDRGIVRGMLSGMCAGPMPVTFSSRAKGDSACATVI
jgi:predicted ArsR family transcriptional regulator